MKFPNIAVGLLALALVSTTPAQPPAGRLVNVGGHRLNMICQGQGAPTVIIDGGAGTWSVHYSVIQGRLAQKTRVCTYDRAGLGESEPGPRPRTSRQMVEELHRLLHEAGIAPPVVLVGHSLGGYNVRIYQEKYPQEVSAIVLLDSAHESQWERLPQEARQLVASAPPFIRAAADQARQGLLKPADVERDLNSVFPPEVRAAMAATLLTAKPYEGRADEIEGAIESAAQVPRNHRLGDLPLVVLTARNSFGAFEGSGIPVAEANRVWMELQAELARLSRRSLHLFSDKDHNLHVNDPDAVVAAIEQAVNQVRAQQPQALGALGLPSTTLPLRSTPEVDALLEKLESTYNAMDAEAFTSMFTEDVEQLDVNRRVHVKGRANWLAWTRQINSAHITMQRRHRGRARVGNWVVTEIEWSGTVRAAALGVPADRHYRYTGLGMLRLENGPGEPKIRQQILYGDFALLTEQLAGREGSPASP